MEYDPVVKIVSRKTWDALPPRSSEPLPLPAQRIMFMFTDTKRCESKEECVKAMQQLQKHYMEKGMPDIPFSFLIGGDIRIYEGRGWKTRIRRTDIRKWNDDRIVIGYICEQKVDDKTTAKMINKAYSLMYHGIDNKYLVNFDKREKEVDIDNEMEVLQRELDRLKKRKKELESENEDEVKKENQTKQDNNENKKDHKDKDETEDDEGYDNEDEDESKHGDESSNEKDSGNEERSESEDDSESKDESNSENKDDYDSEKENGSENEDVDSGESENEEGSRDEDVDESKNDDGSEHEIDSEGEDES